MKDKPAQEIERAIEAAVLGLTGRTTRVSIVSMEWDEATARVDIKLSAWDKLSSDPFAGAL